MLNKQKSRGEDRLGTELTGTVRGLAVRALLMGPHTGPPSVGRSRLSAAPEAALQTQAPAGQRAGAPGAPRRQTPIHGTVLQGTVPPSVCALTEEQERDITH